VRRKTVFADGDTKRPIRIILGDRPHTDEWRIGRPFVGSSGGNLEKYAGIPIDSDRRLALRILVTNTAGMASPFVVSLKRQLRFCRKILVLGEKAWVRFHPFMWKQRKAMRDIAVFLCRHPSPNYLGEDGKRELMEARKFLDVP
jgi:uracil-DNA glycosylase